MRTRASFVLGGLLVAACSAPPTEVLVVVDSDLAVPAELDEIVVTVTHPDGVQIRQSTAALGDGELPLPRSLAMVHEGGPLGAYRVAVEGRLAGAVQVRREGALSFVSQEIRVWRVYLSRACMGVDCAGTTCDGGACRAVDVGEAELEPYVPDGERDAGVDAGGPEDAGTDAGDVVDAGGTDAGACDPVCDSVTPCTCGGGCAACALRCPSAGCDATCTGAGTTCTVSAEASNGTTAACRSGATCTVDARSTNGFDMECVGSGTVCDVDCTNAVGCSLRCSMGAMCSLICAGATGCEIRPCTGGGSTCGDVEVCNRACP